MTRSTVKPILATVAFGLTLAVGASAFAHGGGRRGGLFGGLHALNLTADQKQKVHDIFTAERPTLKQLQGSVKTARQAIAAKLMAPGTLTSADLDSLAQQAAQAQADLAHERLNVAIQVRNVLTPDQLSQAASIHAQMQQLRGQMQQLLEKHGAS